MTKDEALLMALATLEEGNFVYPTALRTAIIEALAQPSDSVEQEPVGLDEDTLRDMAGSAFETAMAFGISTDSFERLARDVNKRIVAALAQPEPEQEPFKPDWLSYRQGKLDGAAEALAQPEQERNFCPRCGKRLMGALGPVSIHTCCPPTTPTGWDNGLSQDYDKKLGAWFSEKPNAKQELRDVLAQPQSEKKPAKDWVASHNEICALLRQAHDALALTSYPPKRKWVGLTGDDMDDITSTAMDKADAMLLTETKLKEKNT